MRTGVSITITPTDRHRLEAVARDRNAAQTFKAIPACIVGMEACLSAHFVARTLRRLGHEPRIIPANYAKPFAKGQKNDYNDAEAIAEAALRPNLRVVREKTQDELDLQAYHRIRSRLVSRRTATVNQIRAVLIEQGIAIRPGLRALRSSLFDILKNRADEISPRMSDLIVGLYEDFHRDVSRRAMLSASFGRFCFAPLSHSSFIEPSDSRYRQVDGWLLRPQLSDDCGETVALGRGAQWVDPRLDFAPRFLESCGDPGQFVRRGDDGAERHHFLLHWVNAHARSQLTTNQQLCTRNARVGRRRSWGR